MNRRLILIGLIASSCIGTEALAVHAVGQSTLLRRHLAACMTKHMNADKTLPFNTAARICKEELNKQGDSLASNAAGMPANSR
jgi:hypothetical protein